MTLGDLSDPRAVLSAIAEFQRIGQSAFLAKYRSGGAVSYFLEYEGQLYDSKAIAAAAHGYQFPEEGPLDPSRFSGGAATVERKLRQLGFNVVRTGASWVSALEPGTTYSWEQLGAIFGFRPAYLSAVGGMAPRPEHGVVLLITHPGGARRIDYGDYWDGRDLIYTGRGTRGDQVREGANRLVGNNDAALLVFEKAGSRALEFRRDASRNGPRKPRTRMVIRGMCSASGCDSMVPTTLSHRRDNAPQTGPPALLLSIGHDRSTRTVRPRPRSFGARLGIRRRRLCCRRRPARRIIVCFRIWRHG
jgi:hypothetical protein